MSTPSMCISSPPTRPSRAGASPVRGSAPAPPGDRASAHARGASPRYQQPLDRTRHALANERIEVEQRSSIPGRIEHRSRMRLRRMTGLAVAGIDVLTACCLRQVVHTGSRRNSGTFGLPGGVAGGGNEYGRGRGEEPVPHNWFSAIGSRLSASPVPASFR